MLSPLPRGWPLLCLLLVVINFQNCAIARSKITPTLQLEESFVSNKTSVLDESGQITTLSPGFRYEAIGARSVFTLDYVLNANYYNSLSQRDQVDQSLNLRSEINHVPNRWNSQITGTIKQANSSPTGIQIVNPIFQSENTREFRTIGLGTFYQDRLSESIDYQSVLVGDYAGFEGDKGTDSLRLGLTLSNSNTRQKLHWSTSLSSRVTSSTGVDEQIDTIRVDLDYRFNRKYSIFLSVDKSETANEYLNETGTNIGVNWTPGRNSTFKLGTGKRGDDTSYTLYSLIKTQRITYTLNYDETITTSRDLLISETTSESGFIPTSQSLSITPVLLKTGRFSITAVGRRTDLTLSYLQQTKTQSALRSAQEKTNGVSISAKHSLSNSSSAQIYISRQETESSQQNTLDDASVSFDSQWSRNVNFLAELRKTQQTSDVIDNEYVQNLLSFTVSISF